MGYYETLYEHGIYYAPSPGALVHYGQKSGFADVSSYMHRKEGVTLTNVVANVYTSHELHE